MTSRIASLLLSLTLIGPAMAIEEPAYKVLTKEDSMEVREYAPFLIAETVVEGDMDQASNKGFRLIADFIFGNNQAPDTQAAGKIAMTAPVTLEPQSAKIAMTAPVTMVPQNPGAVMAEAKAWRVHFVMPSQYTMATIPKPKNSAVTLREVPTKVFAVHAYTGFNSLSNVQNKTGELMEWAAKKNMKPLGSPQLSRYDPPWTLPMFRRNEIMVEVSMP